MKAEIKNKARKTDFPVKIELTIESNEELKALSSIMNIARAKIYGIVKENIRKSESDAVLNCSTNVFWKVLHTELLKAN